MVEGTGYVYWRLCFYDSYRLRIHILNGSRYSLLSNVHDLVYQSPQSHVPIYHPCTATFLRSESCRYEYYFVFQIKLIFSSLLFIVTLLGRVLNRFTKDVGCMDDMLPSAFFDVITVNYFVVFKMR